MKNYAISIIHKLYHNGIPHEKSLPYLDRFDKKVTEYLRRDINLGKQVNYMFPQAQQKRAYELLENIIKRYNNGSN